MKKIKLFINEISKFKKKININIPYWYEYAYF